MKPGFGSYFRLFLLESFEVWACIERGSRLKATKKSTAALAFAIFAIDISRCVVKLLWEVVGGSAHIMVTINCIVPVRPLVFGS